MMKFYARILLFSALTTTATIAFAEPGLPPEEAVREALDAHPSVLAARARLGVAKAEANALASGTHEVTVSTSYLRRTVDREGGFNEFDSTITRPFRLPGKAKLDRTAGQFGIVVADNMMADVKHQAGLRLAELWWNWLGAAAEHAVDLQGVSNLEQSLTGIRRRVALRDAALLDANLAEAALGSARFAAAQSKGRTDDARARLAAQFPSLPLPDEAPEIPLPQNGAASFSAMRDQVIERSHEIAAADAHAAKMGAMATRAQRDRFADPTFGVRLFSERDGAEKGAGLVASLPLGGGHRKALANRASHEQSAAAAEASAIRFDVLEIADSDLAKADAGMRAWQRSREGMSAQLAAVLKMRRGYQLGATDLSDLLMAERQTHEAFKAESSARTEALRAITRLRIDSHNLWIGDDHDHGGLKEPITDMAQ
jgi:outer membrane protein, heavy metal efflux system